MDDMLRSAQRGWDIAIRAALPLLVGGVIWVPLNWLTGGLLVGPALVGLFTVALKTPAAMTTVRVELATSSALIAPSSEISTETAALASSVALGLVVLVRDHDVVLRERECGECLVAAAQSPEHFRQLDALGRRLDFVRFEDREGSLPVAAILGCVEVVADVIVN